MNVNLTDETTDKEKRLSGSLYNWYKNNKKILKKILENNNF